MGGLSLGALDVGIDAFALHEVGICRCFDQCIDIRLVDQMVPLCAYGWRASKLSMHKSKCS